MTRALSRSTLLFAIEIALVVAVVLVAPSSSSAQAPPARDHEPSDPAMMVDSTGLDDAARQVFVAGRNLYDLGRFTEAAAQFEQAYALSHRPQLLYNLYLAYRDAGDREKSAAALANYLRDNPDVDERVNLEARLRSLEASIAEEQAA